MSKEEFIKQFEKMKENAELNVLQSLSMERPLSKSEFERFSELAHKKLKVLKNE